MFNAVFLLNGLFSFAKQEHFNAPAVQHILRHLPRRNFLFQPTTRCRIFITSTFANLIAAPSYPQGIHMAEYISTTNSFILTQPGGGRPGAPSLTPYIEGVFLMKNSCGNRWNWDVCSEKGKKFNLRKIHNYVPFITQTAFKGLAKFILSCKAFCNIPINCGGVLNADSSSDYYLRRIKIYKKFHSMALWVSVGCSLVFLLQSKGSRKNYSKAI